ncbi:MAG: class I SAM-dependent methyltransferase [Gammaproteobacteria bacterium]|nr:class I SAM-dependent methyltransferase [Gammaproteobacteria bacterium]
MTASDEIKRQFGRMSRAYANSPGHASDADLDLVIRYLNPMPDLKVLDVATGAGHTACAVAPLVKEVVAIDLTPEMIDRTLEQAKAKEITNLTGRVMDVEKLEFENESFDAVTCRIAPHHFRYMKKALSEIHRVLKVGGTFILEDSCTPPDPELDMFINRVEKLRDHTHVRSYNETQWLRLLDDAGFSIIRRELFRKRHLVADWLERAGLDRASEDKVYKAFAQASIADQQFFEIKYDQNYRALSFCDDKLIARADKNS